MIATSIRNLTVHSNLFGYPCQQNAANLISLDCDAGMATRLPLRRNPDEQQGMSFYIRHQTRHQNRDFRKVDMDTNLDRQIPSIDFDVVVVGGGIIGTGVARDAAMRGLRVALFEKEDFCYGTSAEATRLIHGGLRYLEMYDFGLVREDLRERETLLRLAAHLVYPLRFVLPIYDQSAFYWLRLRAGMLLYDLLSFDKSLPNHTFLSRSDTLRCVPALKSAGLQGAATYFDAAAPWTERLCIENFVSARRYGAVIRNHCQVTGLIYDHGSVAGVQIQDTLSGTRSEVRCRVVVNASGPWLNETIEEFGIRQKPLIRETKGVHLVMPKISDDAVVLFSPLDGRLFFVVPWLNFSYVGTTDTDFSDDADTVYAEPEDVRYLLDSVRTVFPDRNWNQIYYTKAGVRSLARIEGVPESSVSRKHIIFDHRERDGVEGLLSIVGGKLTAYRGIAEDTVDAACRKLGVKLACRTATTALPGGGMRDIEQYIEEQQAMARSNSPLDSEQVEHLARLYGKRYVEIAEIAAREPGLAARIYPDHPDCRAQIIHAVLGEDARTLTDYMIRRSDVGFSASQGVEVARSVADEMARLLGWDTRRTRDEMDAYMEKIAIGQRYQESKGLLRMR